MKEIRIVARKEFQSAFRNRTFMVIAILFLAMSILSVYIGSTTKNAEMRLYEETIASLQAQGATSFPARPQIHHLTILSNLIEYVSMIGAILAITLGYNALTEEKLSGGLKLILSRPIYRDQLLTGKLLGLGAVIAALLALVFVFNVALLALISGAIPTLAEILRLLTFIGISLVYMSIFLTLSLMLSVKMENGSTVFLISLVVWMVFSFVIPQMAETQMSNSMVINSISGLTNQIPQDTTFSRVINAFSPTWHLRELGNQLLEVAPGSAEASLSQLTQKTFSVFLLLLTPSILFGALAYTGFLRDETLVMG